MRKSPWSLFDIYMLCHILHTWPITNLCREKVEAGMLRMLQLIRKDTHTNTGHTVHANTFSQEVFESKQMRIESFSESLCTWQSVENGCSTNLRMGCNSAWVISCFSMNGLLRIAGYWWVNIFLLSPIKSFPRRPCIVVNRWPESQNTSTETQYLHTHSQGMQNKDFQLAFLWVQGFSANTPLRQNVTLFLIAPAN